jgi:uncharacterized protein YceH (UPF0502 family)
MIDPPPGNSNAAPKWKPLDARQRRVLGVLIEKAKTTPAAYPMTVNAIVTGCNQKNNRDPITTLDGFGVEKALDELRTLGAVSEIDWLGRVSKYKHHAYEWLGVNKAELAVMAELLLRGAQALGELRGRAARMEAIPDLAALKPIVDALLGRGLMIALTAPGRGQIVSHNLYSALEVAELKARYAGDLPRAASFDDDEPTRHRPPAPSSNTAALASSLQTAQGGAATVETAERIAGLSAEIAELRAEVASLREKVSELDAKLIAALG